MSIRSHESKLMSLTGDGRARARRRLAGPRRQLPAPRALRLRARADPPGPQGPRDRQAVARLRHRHPLPRRAAWPRRAPASSRWRAISASRPGTGGRSRRSRSCSRSTPAPRLTAGLRAAAFGVPFQPCGGMHGSDLPALNGWAGDRRIPTAAAEDVWVIPTIAPDFAVIHANEVNELGDARIYGTFNWDRIMSRAAKRVFVVAERLASSRVLPGAAGADARPRLHGRGGERSCRTAPGRARAGPLRGRLPGGRGLHGRRARRRSTRTSTRRPKLQETRPMPEWSGFSYIVTNLARFIRPNEITFSGVNSTLPMLACLLAKRAYRLRLHLHQRGRRRAADARRRSRCPAPTRCWPRARRAIFANEDFYDLCTRGAWTCASSARRRSTALGRTNVSVHRRLAQPRRCACRAAAAAR